jgi:hypothetical protein
MSELPQMSTMGGSFAAPNGVAMGRSNVVDDPAERRAPGSSPAVEARAHVGGTVDG